MAKELADLLYVVYGTAVSYGLDMDPVFREVHRSNLSKVWRLASGRTVRGEAPTYSPADVGPLLANQSSSNVTPAPHAAQAYRSQKPSRKSFIVRPGTLCQG